MTLGDQTIDVLNVSFRVCSQLTFWISGDASRQLQIGIMKKREPTRWNHFRVSWTAVTGKHLHGHILIPTSLFGQCLHIGTTPRRQWTAQFGQCTYSLRDSSDPVTKVLACGNNKAEYKTNHFEIELPLSGRGGGVVQQAALCQQKGDEVQQHCAQEPRHREASSQSGWPALWIKVSICVLKNKTTLKKMSLRRIPHFDRVKRFKLFLQNKRREFPWLISGENNDPFLCINHPLNVLNSCFSASIVFISRVKAFLHARVLIHLVIALRWEYHFFFHDYYSRYFPTSTGVEKNVIKQRHTHTV